MAEEQHVGAIALVPDGVSVTACDIENGPLQNRRGAEQAR